MNKTKLILIVNTIIVALSCSNCVSLSQAASNANTTVQFTKRDFSLSERKIKKALLKLQ